MQEVSRARSTSAQAGGRSKPKHNTQIQPLDPRYIAGFVDGEGCFCVSVSKHKTLKRRIEVRPEFEIEVRADDREILERIQSTLRCGSLYHLGYERYGWKPHVKFKVSNISDLQQKIIPYFTRHPLQAKKAKSFDIFRRIVEMVARKEHLQYAGFQKILKLREQMRSNGKKA